MSVTLLSVTHQLHLRQSKFEHHIHYTPCSKHVLNVNGHPIGTSVCIQGAPFTRKQYRIHVQQCVERLVILSKDSNVTWCMIFWLPHCYCNAERSGRFDRLLQSGLHVFCSGQVNDCDKQSVFDVH